MILKSQIMRCARSGVFLAWRILWCAAFAAVLLLTLVVGPRAEIAAQAKYRAFMTIGIGAWWNPSPKGQLGGPFADVGYLAGYHDGDLVTAVDGKPLPSDAPGRIAMLAVPDGTRLAVTVMHKDGRVSTIRVVRSSAYERDAYAGWHINFAARRWAVFAVDMLAYLAGLAAALLLFLRRPHDPVAMVLTVALLTIPLSSGNVATTLPGRLGMIASVIPPLAATIAILLFPDGKLTTPWHWVALALGFVATVPYGIVPDLVAMQSSSFYRMLFYSGEVALLLALRAQFRLTPPGVERQQIKFVMLGAVVSALLAIFATLIDTQLYHYMPEGQRAWMSMSKWIVQALSSLALPAGLLVSLTRYRLYDADTAISRSVAYSALTVGILIVFAGSEKLIEIFGEEYFGASVGAVAGGLGAAVAASMIAPLHHRMTHWTEHRFRSALLHLRQGLPLLLADLRETGTPDMLVDAMLVRIEKGVHAAHGAVVMAGEVVSARGVDSGAVRAWLASWNAPASGRHLLESDRADRLFPLRMPLEADGAGHVGWLLLGPRPDGSFHGRTERAALAEIAEPSARALAIARERQRRDRLSSARDAEREGLIAELGEQVTELGHRLARLEGDRMGGTAA